MGRHPGKDGMEPPPYPLILNLLKDEPAAAKENRQETQPLCYVIPSVAEESKMPALESISRLLDSSATLGMT